MVSCTTCVSSLFPVPGPTSRKTVPRPFVPGTTDSYTPLRRATVIVNSRTSYLLLVRSLPVTRVVPVCFDHCGPVSFVCVSRRVLTYFLGPTSEETLLQPDPTPAPPAQRVWTPFSANLQRAHIRVGRQRRECFRKRTHEGEYL